MCEKSVLSVYDTRNHEPLPSFPVSVSSSLQGLRGAWNTHIRRTSSLSRPLTAILSSLRQLLSSREAAPILRGAAGALAAALLQTLALFEPELEDAASRISSHAESCEEEVLRLWGAFEHASWRNGCGSVGEGGAGAGKVERGLARAGGVLVGNKGEGDMMMTEGVEKGGVGSSALKKASCDVTRDSRKPWVD